MTNPHPVKVTRYASLLGGGAFTGGALTALVLELALRRLGGPAYIQVRQAEHGCFPWFIRAVFVPSFIAVVMLVVLAREAGSQALRPAAAALVLLVLALVVTFAVNVPINIAQFGWNAQAPPADWASIRDRWQIARAVRTVLCVIALGCLGAAVIDQPFAGSDGASARR